MKPLNEITILLRSIEEGYRKKAWHGPNLRGSIRGLTAEEASWRFERNRHNIWEIVVHCAYWKYVVRRRILGERKGSFPLKGSNWFTRPDHKQSHELWRQDIVLLENMHNKMVETIAELDASVLNKYLPGGKVTYRTIITGIAAHDVYHAGQIQLLKKLMT